MSTCADAKTTPVTKDYEDGFERTFGKKRGARGRWVQDPSTGKLIPAHEYVPPHSSERVPVMSDLYMDGTASQDGVDIGSRAKRREYMRATGSADASDYSSSYFDKKRTARDRQVEDSTRKTVAEVAKLDRRHLAKFVDEGKKR